MSEAQAAAAKPKKNLGGMLRMMFAVVNLAVMGGSAYLIYVSTIGWVPPEITEDMAKRDVASLKSQYEFTPLIYTLDKFTVNLEGEPKRTIRLEVNLQMLGAEGFEEVMGPENKARVRDGIVRILNEKKFAELDSIQGKLFLKDKIASEVNSLLRQGIVKDVFFSDFVVQ